MYKKAHVVLTNTTTYNIKVIRVTLETFKQISIFAFLLLPIILMINTLILLFYPLNWCRLLFLGGGSDVVYSLLIIPPFLV